MPPAYYKGNTDEGVFDFYARLILFKKFDNRINRRRGSFRVLNPIEPLEISRLAK